MIQTKLIRPSTKPKLMTVCFLIENGHILLGYKKRGFGANLWNGFGGKVQPDESIEQCALREMKEEAGVDISRVENRGKMLFKFPNNEQPFEVHIFVAKAHTGEPVESEEMRPAWFNINQVPYSMMWIDDPFWLPQVLNGQSADGYIRFDENQGIAEKEVNFY